MKYIHFITLTFLIISLSQAQTIYTDTIPKEDKNLCLVYVTEDLLEHLSMTAEEFYEQKVKQDFHWLNLAHYFSGNTNDTNQLVEIIAGNNITILPTSNIPGNYSPSDALQWILLENDGVWDFVDERISCWEPNTIICYGPWEDNGISFGNIFIRPANNHDTLRLRRLQHSFAVNYYGLPTVPASEPVPIYNRTDRTDGYARYRGWSGADVIGKWTARKFNAETHLYSSPYIRPPNSESDGIRLIRNKLASFQPLLKADILLPSDTLQANSQFTLSAGLNRDTLSQYDYNWAIHHEGELTASYNAPGMESFVTSFDEIGQYTIELFVQKSCGGQSDSVSRTVMVVDEMTSTASAEEREVDIYPNPTSGIIHISGIPNPANDQIHLSVNNLEYEILNVAGQAVQRGMMEDHGIRIQDLSSGMYFLRVHKGQGVYQARFVKE